MLPYGIFIGLLICRTFHWVMTPGPFFCPSLWLLWTKNICPWPFLFAQSMTEKKNMSERLHASRNAILISSSALLRTNIDTEKLAFVGPFPNGQSMGFWYIHHFTPDFHGTCLAWGPLATSCCRHSSQQPFWKSVGWAPIGTVSGFITSITGIHQRKILYPLVMKSG